MSSRSLGPPVSLAALAAAWLSVGTGPVQAAAAGCTVAKFADLPVTILDRQPLTSVRINGVERNLIVDSGVFFKPTTFRR